MNFYLLVRLSSKFNINGTNSKCLLRIIFQKLELVVASIQAVEVCEEIYGILSDWIENNGLLKSCMRLMEVEMVGRSIVCSVEE